MVVVVGVLKVDFQFVLILLNFVLLLHLRLINTYGPVIFINFHEIIFLLLVFLKDCDFERIFFVEWIKHIDLILVRNFIIVLNRSFFFTVIVH